MYFTKRNLRNKKFLSEATGYQYVDKIPYSAKETVLYHGNGLNIHPTLWEASWFENEVEAAEYIESIRKSYER